MSCCDIFFSGETPFFGFYDSKEANNDLYLPLAEEQLPHCFTKPSANKRNTK
jgi:hypothetical protein